MKFPKKQLLFLLGIFLFIGVIYVSPIVKGVPVDKNPSLSEKYESQFENYTFNYPSDWFLEEAPEVDGIVTISNYDPSLSSSLPTPDEKRFTIDIVVLKDSPNYSNLDEFLSWHDQNNYEGTGIRTIIYDTKPTMINENGVIQRKISSINGLVLEVFFKGENKVYLLAARDDESFNGIFTRIVNSFSIKSL